MCGEPTLLRKLQAAKEAAKSPAKINKVRSCTLSQVPIASTSDQHRDCKPTLAPAHLDCPSCSYYIHFKSNGENLDDFVVQIDAPLLDNISITLFNQLIFDTPQLCCFLGHTERSNVAHRWTSSFLVAASRSASFDKMGLTITRCSSWASCARHWTGSSHHSHKSVPCPYPCSLLWNALEYMGVHSRDRNGKMTWRTDNGWSFFSCLLM